MADEMVVGLFEAIGTAEDVRNRLIYEGVPAGDIELRVLKIVEPLPPSMAAETHAYAIDPFYSTTLWEKYRPRIRNGETAVLVRIHSDEEADIAINTMRQFAPMEVDRISLAEEASLLRDKAAGPPP